MEMEHLLLRQGCRTSAAPLARQNHFVTSVRACDGASPHRGSKVSAPEAERTAASAPRPFWRRCSCTVSNHLKTRGRATTQTNWEKNPMGWGHRGHRSVQQHCRVGRQRAGSCWAALVTGVGRRPQQPPVAGLLPPALAHFCQSPVPTALRRRP